MKDTYSPFVFAGAAPIGDAATTTIFDTTAAQGAKRYGDARRRAIVSMLNSHSGTLLAQVSTDGGATWRAHYSEAIAANTVTAYRAIRLDGFQDLRIQWTNGGTAQNPFVVTVSLDDGMGNTASFSDDISGVFGEVSATATVVSPDGTASGFISAGGQFGEDFMSLRAEAGLRKGF